MEDIKPPVINVITACSYLKLGLSSIYANAYIELRYLDEITEIKGYYEQNNHILLVLDMSSSDSISNFRSALLFIMRNKIKNKIGVLVSRYNDYLTYYISKKLKGKVTFFNSHNYESGLFYKNLLSWSQGKTFKPMPTTKRYKDSQYGFCLKEWLSLVIPLSGESMQELSQCLSLPTQSLYFTRKKALKKMGLSSYKHFCMLFIHGRIRIENNRLMKKQH
ncbi:TPA: hypothetical protein ACIBFG_004476 [Salmonella enterica subsp. enterica serovar Bahrenfeld]|nr:hypothetical protein [Salmonella enterica]HAR9319069.1 hypothetical protein [Salmonella enterica]